jgi:hypothetical protein
MFTLFSCASVRQSSWGSVWLVSVLT